VGHQLGRSGFCFCGRTSREYVRHFMPTVAVIIREIDAYLLLLDFSHGFYRMVCLDSMMLEFFDIVFVR
jgi:hypothetical protein